MKDNKKGKKKGVGGRVGPTSGTALVAGAMGDVSRWLTDVVRGGPLNGVGLEDMQRPAARR